MPTIAVSDTRLDVRAEGVGAPVVLVHGSAGDRRGWDDVLPTLAADRHVVSVSLRHGWPHEPAQADTGPDPDRDVDDLVAVLTEVVDDPRSVGDGRVHVVGHSLGGVVALRAAIRRPDLVRSLCMVEPPVFALLVGDPPRPGRLLRLAATRPRTAAAIIGFVRRGPVPARRAAARGDLEEAVRRFGTAVLGPGWFARMTPERFAVAVRNSSLGEFLHPNMGAIEAADVARVGVPTLLVDGDASPAFFGHLSAALERTLPDARRVTVAGTSHLVPEAAPDGLLAVLVPFLDAT